MKVMGAGKEREGERRREKERDREEQKIHAVQNYLNNDVS